MTRQLLVFIEYTTRALEVEPKHGRPTVRVVDRFFQFACFNQHSFMKRQGAKFVPLVLTLEQGWDDGRVNEPIPDCRFRGAEVFHFMPLDRPLPRLRKHVGGNGDQHGGNRSYDKALTHRGSVCERSAKEKTLLNKEGRKQGTEEGR